MGRSHHSILSGDPAAAHYITVVYYGVINYLPVRSLIESTNSSYNFLDFWTGSSMIAAFNLSLSCFIYTNNKLDNRYLDTITLIKAELGEQPFV